MYNERCVIDEADLFDQWKVFFPATDDEVKQLRKMRESINKLKDLGFLCKFADEPPSWEVRRILKARLPASELEELRRQLVEAAEKQ